MKIVKYSTENCPSCKKLSRVLACFEGVEVEEVTLNPSEDLETFRELKINTVPTIIKYNDEGKEIDRISGLPAIAQLRDFLKA